MSTPTTGTHVSPLAWVPGCMDVLEDVLAERHSQVLHYGIQHGDTLADGTGPETRWLMPFTFDSAKEIEASLRYDYEQFEEDSGKPTWVHLVREELAEAFAEDDPTRLEEELLQVAALCVSWIEALRTRS